MFSFYNQFSPICHLFSIKISQDSNLNKKQRKSILQEDQIDRNEHQRYKIKHQNHQNNTQITEYREEGRKAYTFFRTSTAGSFARKEADVEGTPEADEDGTSFSRYLNATLSCTVLGEFLEKSKTLQIIASKDWKISPKIEEQIPKFEKKREKKI